MWVRMCTLVLGMAMLTACHESPYIQNPGDNSQNQPDEQIGSWADNDSAFQVELAQYKAKYGKRVLSVDEARELCIDGSYDAGYYYVYGLVKETSSSNTFYMVSSCISYPRNTFEVYSGKSAANSWGKDAVRGRWLIVYSTITYYATYSQPETNKGVAEVKYSSYEPPYVPTTGKGTKENPYTIEDVIKLVEGDHNIADSCWICGYMRGTNLNDSLETSNFSTEYNIVLAQDTVETRMPKMVTVSLWSGLGKKKQARQAISPKYKPENIGKQVAAQGFISRDEGGVDNVKRMSSPNVIAIDGTEWKKQ